MEDYVWGVDFVCVDCFDCVSCIIDFKLFFRLNETYFRYGVIIVVDVVGVVICIVFEV